MRPHLWRLEASRNQPCRSRASIHLRSGPPCGHAPTSQDAGRITRRAPGLETRSGNSVAVWLSLRSRPRSHNIYYRGWKPTNEESAGEACWMQRLFASMQGCLHGSSLISGTCRARRSLARNRLALFWNLGGRRWLCIICEYGLYCFHRAVKFIATKVAVVYSSATNTWRLISRGTARR